MAERQAVKEQSVGSGRNDGRDIGDNPMAISSLIAAIASDDGLMRETARQRLVHIGRPAVSPLVEALAGGDIQMRWEIVKCLGQMADPKAAPALVRALRDEEFGIRWLAAEGLILLGFEGLGPLLRALIEHADSVSLRQSAHHVLSTLSRRGLREVLRPVLAALEGLEPSLQVPLAAEDARDALARAKKRQGARRGRNWPNPRRSGRSRD
jgi:HEAT repeat protein